jgi:hypothetical protein
MRLDVLGGRFEKRLNVASRLFNKFAPTVKRNCRPEQMMFLDGLLSYTWQAWGRFCRDLVMHSCLGGTTKAGVALPISIAPASKERVSYLAIRAKQGNAPVAGSTNSIWRYEPTWGDVSTLVKIIPVANPANSTQLLTAFGGISKGPVHLQKVRNATAHANDQNFKEILALQLYYLGSPIRFPCEACFWVDTATGDFAFITWVEEMRFVASIAV